MYQEARNIKSILWGQGLTKFPVEQIIGSNSAIRVHTSNATSKDGLIELALYIKPDVIVFDTTIPGDCNWYEFAMNLRSRVGNVGLVAIISNGNAQVINDLARAQVSGIIQADQVHLELPHALRAFQRNEIFFNSQIAKVICSLLSVQSTAAPMQPIVQDRGLLPALTNRELEVLACLTKGLNYRQIAEKLFVSSSTVKTHVNNIFTKLSINDRTQAVLYGLKHGIDQMVPELFGEESEGSKTQTATGTEYKPTANVQSLNFNNEVEFGNMNAPFNVQPNNNFI